MKILIHLLIWRVLNLCQFVRRDGRIHTIQKCPQTIKKNRLPNMPLRTQTDERMDT